MRVVLKEEETIKENEILIPNMEKQIEDIKRNENTEEKQAAKTLKVSELQSKLKENEKKMKEKEARLGELYREHNKIGEELESLED
jgi:hypothetical protein